MIEWKLFWTITATVISAALAALCIVDVLPRALATILAVAITVVTVLVSHSIVDACEMWRGTTSRQRKRVWAGISTIALTYVAWTITAIWLPVDWINILVMAALLGMIAVTVYWTARGLEWRLTVAPPAPRRADTEDVSLLGTHERIVRAALHRAGIRWVRVLPGVTDLRDNAGEQFRVRVQSKELLGKHEKTGARDDVPPQAMEPLAIALSEITGKPLDSDWVRVRKEKGAGLYSITILQRDVMAEVIPYVDTPEATTSDKPALVGIEIDGRQHLERIDQHQRHIGSSRAGKSSLIHCIIAHGTRCQDAVIWIGGVQKLYDLVAGWLEPYHGKNLRPPIDWIANGHDDTLKMMAAAMAIARWRQSRPMSQRKWRKIILILDEFSFLADSKRKIVFDGEEVTAADLASQLVKGATSGGVYVHFASQRSTSDHFGPKGGDVVNNVAVNNAFRGKDFAEVGRLTNDWKLPPPTHKGEFYSFSDGKPLHLKAPYIQSNDPTEPRLHDGATIADISWSRRHLVQGGLTDTEGLAAAGDAYTGRHQVVNDAFMTYLTTGETPQHTEPEHGSVYEQVRAELLQIAADAGLDLTDNDPPEPDQVGVYAGAKYMSSRENRIKWVLDSTEYSGDGLDAGHIVQGLAILHDDADRAVVSATLSRMADRGEITRIRRGIYAPLNRTNKQTNTQPTGG